EVQDPARLLLDLALHRDFQDVRVPVPVRVRALPEDHSIPLLAARRAREAVSRAEVRARGDARRRRAHVSLSSAHFGAGGVRGVGTATMTTPGGKVSAEMTGCPPLTRPSPTFAKMSPTSPRGIIPIPTAARFRPGPSAPSAHACFPRTAASVRT